MLIETVAITSLSFDPSNARKHSPKNLQAIRGSLKKFGQQKPIVVDGNNVVVAGNGTLEAAKSLGWKEINIVRTKLTGPEAIAFALADNRTAELAEWDLEPLNKTLQSLKDIDFDLGAIGFDDDFMEAHTPEKVVEGLTDPDEVPENVETRCKPGDLWMLGNHRLLCGDSTNVQHVERLMGGNTPVLMSTDPPYGVKLDQSWRDKALGSKAMGKGNKKTIQNDDQASWPGTYAQFPGNVCYVWHATSFTDVVKKDLEDCDFEVRQMIIWNKSIMVMGRSAYHWKHEPCWYAVRKGKDANWKGDRKQTTVWDAASPNHIMSGSKDDKTEHPSQKPILLSEIPIMNHTNKGDGVYDPFLGSGSTLIACEKTGRSCYGMEIDPHYCDVIIERWERFTGQKAKLSDSLTSVGETVDG